MKKLWLPIVIVLIWLAFFVVGPWYAGGKVEQRFDDLLADLNTNGLFKFEKTEYNKGLMSSDTTITMSINMDMFGPAAEQMKQTMTLEPISLKGEVKHGPFLLDDGFEFAVGRINFVPDVTEQHQQEISKIFGTDNPLDLFVQFNWSDTSTAGGKLIGFTLPEEGMTSQEAIFTVDLTDGGKHLVSAFNWDGLEANYPQQNAKTFKIGKISLASDQVQAIEEIWVGGAKFDIDRVEFSDVGMKGFADKFSVISKASMDDSKQFMNGSADFTLAKVSVNDMNYVEDLVYKVSFNHIHAESAQKLAKVVQEAQQAGGSPEAMQMAMGLQLMGILPELLNQGFSINIDALDAKVMGEQVSSKLLIDVPEGTPMGPQAIAAVTATADISIAKALLDQFPAIANPEMVQGLIMQGFIVEENGVLKAHAEFKDGQLLVNGNLIPIPMM